MPLSSRRPKRKLSAAVYASTLKALDQLRREKGLRSRSEAVAEALAEWAAEYRKDSVVEEAVARYGRSYAAIGANEEKRAERLLDISLENRGEP